MYVASWYSFNRRMYLWERGLHTVLVGDAESEGASGRTGLPVEDRRRTKP